ncbi:MAG: hypothetical protein IPF54_09665 [Draconibacterium sp.]|nr:hypothetical protein [Draconibacterium sp.]
MNSTSNKNNRSLLILSCLFFFIFSFVYLNWFAGYIFFYQEKSSLFLVSPQYLAEHLTLPGNFLNYLGELQTAFYFYPAIGAILVSSEIILIIWMISLIGKAINRNRSFSIPFVIGAALFYLQINYQYNAFNNLGILIQLTLFYWVIRFFNSKFQWIPILATPALYLLFGSFSLIFILLFSQYIMLKRNEKWIVKLALLWISAIVFFIAGKEFLFFQTTEKLILLPFSEQKIGLQIQLFFAVIVLIVLLPVILKINITRIASFSIRKIKLIEIVPFAILGGLIFISIPRIDDKNTHYFHVEKLFYQQKYNEIIAFNREFPSNNILTNYFNNIALSQTGKLNDELFGFPQSPDGQTLFLKWEIVSEVLKRGGYFYYYLGMVNEAQRWAYEYMVMRGNTPEGIKMIIKTELINGNYKSAYKFISILKNSIFYRKEAREFEKLLFDDKAIDLHPELGKIKRLRPKHDFFVLSENPAANVDLILAADSTNRIALEYKFASMLLQSDMKGIVEKLPLLQKTGETQVPKNVEEAVVAYSLLNLKKYPEFEGLIINPQTVIRFNEYYKIFQQNQANKEKAQNALAMNFADTFWYYVFFN